MEEPEPEKKRSRARNLLLSGTLCALLGAAAAGSWLYPARTTVYSSSPNLPSVEISYTWYGKTIAHPTNAGLRFQDKNGQYSLTLSDVRENIQRRLDQELEQEMGPYRQVNAEARRLESQSPAMERLKSALTKFKSYF